MERATVAVCLISADFLRSKFCVEEEVPFLLEKSEKEGLLLLPVLVRPCLWKVVPWVEETQMLPRDGQSVSVDFSGTEDVAFTEIAERVFSFLKDEYTPPVPVPKFPPLPEECVDITRMPETGNALFGRSEELKLLDEAWDSPEARVMALVAWGGVGKSTLVNRWLERIRKDNFRGAQKVFAWSFYSQGSGERVTSADLFIRTALKFFGDADPDAGSPWDRGQRLAGLVNAQRALLLLDGMEPLQSPHEFERGKLTDPALAALLRGLAREETVVPSDPAEAVIPTGLCVISTREAVVDLDSFPAQVQTIDLEKITPEAGRALLRVGGVFGRDTELEALAEEFGPHALSLTLLASYIHMHEGHRPEAAERLPEKQIQKGSEEESVAAARATVYQVLAGFQEVLVEGPDLELLCQLGFFDRPAEPEDLSALRTGEPIEGLTINQESPTIPPCHSSTASRIETRRPSKPAPAKPNRRPSPGAGVFWQAVTGAAAPGMAGRSSAALRAPEGFGPGAAGHA
jgi:hypothetical protein